VVAFATVDHVYGPENWPLITPDSPPGMYRGPRGGFIQIAANGDRQRLPDLRAARQQHASGSVRNRSKRDHVKALQEWAAIHTTRDDRIRSAAKAGIGVNEITRITGLAKTTVIRILRR
jgi:hypothetical protein